MIDFHYTRADTIANAVRQISADPEAKFIAGGTNLIDLMKDDVERPARLIDISRLPLKSVEETVRLNDLVTTRRKELETRVAEWESLSAELEASV